MIINRFCRLALLCAVAAMAVSCAYIDKGIDKGRDLIPDIKPVKKTFNDKIVDVINKSRKKHGLQEVRLDYAASRAAELHCSEMIARNYFSHISRDGSKPYHRYNYQVGGVGHISENLYLYATNFDFNKSEKNLLKLAEQGHLAFMAETPPNDGHRQTILKPYHNKVGVAVAFSKNRFVYCEEFADSYIELKSGTEINLSAGQETTITGRVADPASHGIYMVSISYDTNLTPPPPFAKDKGYYEDYSAGRTKPKAPWDFKINKNTGEFSFIFKPSASGIYYLKYYLKNDPDSIPYDGGEVSSKEGFPAAAQVIIVR